MRRVEIQKDTDFSIFFWYFHLTDRDVGRSCYGNMANPGGRSVKNRGIVRVTESSPLVSQAIRPYHCFRKLIKHHVKSSYERPHFSSSSSGSAVRDPLTRQAPFRYTFSESVPCEFTQMSKTLHNIQRRS